MARRHRPPESAHPHRWMVSYADFMTLLFAFFVVLYAASSVHKEKFDKISQALIGIFESPSGFTTPISITNILPPIIYDPQQDAFEDEDYLDIQAEQNNLQALLQETLKEELKQPEFRLEQMNDWILIEMPIDQLFESGELGLEGEMILGQLAKTLARFKHPVNVEVHTSGSDLKAENPWQASADIGAKVVNLLVLEGVAPQRLALVGLGPYQPVATNDDEEGETINRRIQFMIDRTGQLRERSGTVTNAHLSAKPKGQVK